jgi:hypothetical protein
MALSTEALEDLATRVRWWALARVRARIEGSAAPLVVRPDPAPLASAYEAMRTADPALAGWLAEAIVLPAVDAPAESYAKTWREEPIAIRGEAPIDVRALSIVLVHEANAGRRALIARLADDKAREHLSAAREMVDAFRAASSERLHRDDASQLCAAIGWGEAANVTRAARAVLDSTDDIFYEADGWLRSRLGLPRTGELAWSDRYRVRAAMRASELVALGDRAGIASRWLVRSGLESAVSGVRDATSSPVMSGLGVFAIVDEPGARATLVGTPSRTVHGTVDLTAATCEAALSRTARETRICERAGLDRLHRALAFVLGRRLFLEPSFLVREAAVDKGARENAQLELLYDELCVSRLESARALFALDVLARKPDLAGRFRELVARAIGTAPAPAWAAHDAANWALTRPPAMAIANVLEPQLRESLRDRYDEDWFRNPRTGEALEDRFAAMRSQGTLAAFAKARGVEDPETVITADAFARRMREAFG